ncbi:hypothetical protein BST81_24920 [Leptolyngbya sp. 'hensonii']|nr:hypothetical protein BST81_24920 [Leptolyngbya sp. 'hensonii']
MLASLWIISRFGWSALADRYGTDQKPIGQEYYWCSGSFGPLTNYNGGLEVVLAREGIYVALIKLFRFAHTPVLLPWSTVTGIDVWSFLSFQYTRLTIHSNGTPFELFLPLDSKATAEALWTENRS